MKNKLVQLVDDSDPNSLGSYFRKKRIKVFAAMINQIQTNPISILDVGGRSDFWENMSEDIIRWYPRLFNFYKKTGREIVFRKLFRCCEWSHSIRS